MAVERRVEWGVWGWRKGEMSMVGKVGGGEGEWMGMIKVRWGKDWGVLIWSMEVMVSSLV